MGEAKPDGLHRIFQEIQGAFQKQKRVLSYFEYLEVFRRDPARQSRDAARYLAEMLDYYGTTPAPRPFGSVPRYKVFDQVLSQEGGADNEALLGQEEVQAEVRRAAQNFAQEGRTNRVILLHGPNGSAKSTICACLMRGLEDYSTRDEGALYRFHWVFPKKAQLRGTIGFGGDKPKEDRPGSYAHLGDDELDSKVLVEVRDHPLFLLPPAERRAFLAEYLPADYTLPRYITHGSLCQKNQQIFQALLSSYGGSLEEVLRHVRVERYFISRRYRVGAVTLGPELSVDARERQVTADRNLGSLPLSLQGLSLYEVTGELVDAMGGLLELSDLLKRPLDAYKYLQMTAETGEVSLPSQSLLINSVLLASGNELHLGALREHPEFESFRGRFDLIRVPYLRNHLEEQRIYDRQIGSRVRGHVAPHATALAARFAVLTRLKRPNSKAYLEPFARLAESLTAWQKMQLFAGREGERSAVEGPPDLWPASRELFHEFDDRIDYEASFGASPREMRALLLDAAQDPRFLYLSPFAVLDELDELCKRREDYAFLRMTAEPNGFHDHEQFRRDLSRWLFDTIEDDFRRASGLVEEGRYDELLTRYIEQVSAALKGESIKNTTTRKDEAPSEKQMQEIEKLLGAQGDAKAYRQSLMGRIAAWALEHPGAEIKDSQVFRDLLARLRRSVFEDKRGELGQICRLLVEEEQKLKAPDRERISGVIRQLEERFGYTGDSARDAAARLLTTRYSEFA